MCCLFVVVVVFVCFCCFSVLNFEFLISFFNTYNIMKFSLPLQSYYVIYEFFFFFRFSSDIMGYTAKHMPKFNSISISGYHMQEAGGMYCSLSDYMCVCVCKWLGRIMCACVYTSVSVCVAFACVYDYRIAFAS